MSEILIAGGGIGGLTAALALHARGIDATVVEATREIRPLGVGINLLPHSVRVLAGLGLQDALAATAIETAELAYYNRHGQRIWSEPRGVGAGYDYPQFSVHRGELQMLLLRVATERLGADRVRCGHAVRGFEQTDDGVLVRIVDRGGDGRTAELRGRALVGADGIHSSVRAQLHPGEGPPRYAGRMLWRATSRAPALPDGALDDHGGPPGPEVRLLSRSHGPSPSATASRSSTGSPSSQCPATRRRHRTGRARSTRACSRAPSHAGASTGSTSPR